VGNATKPEATRTGQAPELPEPARTGFKGISPSGEWVESETLRVWVAGCDGYVFGSGWHRDETGG